VHPDTPIRRGLVTHLDAADVRSYAGEGMSWRDLEHNRRYLAARFFPGGLRDRVIPRPAADRDPYGNLLTHSTPSPAARPAP
jgi:hypothetical protein